MEILKNEIALVKNEDQLVNIKKFAKLLDSQFEIPNTNFKFGIDPLLNFIPYIGSYTGIFTGFAIILMARKNGAGSKVLLKMSGNIFIDFLVGLIPILGHFGDFFIKCNDRNVKLLEEHFNENKHPGSGKGIILGIIFAFLLFLILATLLIIFVNYLIFSLLFKLI